MRDLTLASQAAIIPSPELPMIFPLSFPSAAKEIKMESEAASWGSRYSFENMAKDPLCSSLMKNRKQRSFEIDECVEQKK